jgi:stage III sporulation protein AH
MKKIRRKNQMVITALALMIAVAGYLNFSGKEVSLISNPESESASQNQAEESGEVALSDAELDDTDAVSVDSDAVTALYEEDDMLSDAGTDDTTLDTADADTDDLETVKTTTASGDASSEVSETAANVDASLDVSDDSLISAAVDDTVEDTVATDSTAVANKIVSAQLKKEQSRAKNKELLMDIVNSSNVTNKQKKQALNQLLQLSDCMEKEAAAEQVLSAKGYEDCIVSMTEDSVDVMVALDEITDVDRAKIEDCVQRKTGVSINNIVISSMK